jgi:hypothetical protein
MTQRRSNTFTYNPMSMDVGLTKENSKNLSLFFFLLLLLLLQKKEELTVTQREQCTENPIPHISREESQLCL